jgi:hypothetical protein
MKLSLFLFASLVYAETVPRITFSKSFPGSTPAYVAIEVNRDGSAVYKESPKDENPIKFKISQENTDAIFALCDKLDHFNKPFESGLKVAFMGEKTLRYENGTETHQAKFNYSQDEDARAITDWFERISDTQTHYFDLERTIRFDKLGVNKSLLQFEAAMERKRIIAPERFLPLLDRVAKNESYMHMARERAAMLADQLRNPKPKAE